MKKKKRLVLMLSVLCLFYSSYAQLPQDNEGNVSFSDVVTIKNELTADNIFDNFKEWFSTKSSNFNRSNSEKNYQGANSFFGTKWGTHSVDALFKNTEPLKLSDKGTKKIIGKVVNKYTGGTHGCIRILYIEYDIIVEIKDGRYRYNITNFTYTHYNQGTLKQSQMYGFSDEGACKSKGTLRELLGCNKCKNEFTELYNYLKNDVNALILDMTTFVDKANKNDDW